LGDSALYYNSTGTNHTIIGHQAGNQIISPGGINPNTVIGHRALFGGSSTPSLNTAYDNVAI
jgi:hypothetical protein